MIIPFKEAEYGFDWGGVHVERIAADDKKGWVVLGITTKKEKNIQIYVTKTGKVRIWRSGEELT